MSMPKKPVLNPQIFWDVDVESMNYDAKAHWIIVRVFERGDVPDIRNCRRYYGDNLVKEALLNAKYLMLHTLYLASAVAQEPIENFRCYKNRQLNPTLYPY